MLSEQNTKPAELYPADLMTASEKSSRLEECYLCAKLCFSISVTVNRAILICVRQSGRVIPGKVIKYEF